MNTLPLTAMATRYSWPLASAQPANALPHPTWAEWCEALQRQIAHQQRVGELPFSDRELAYLEFVRWLHHTDRITS